MINIKKILFATSLSQYNRIVYEYALHLASKNNSEIIMLHAIEPISEMGRFFIKQYIPDEFTQKVQDMGDKKLLEEMQKHIEEFHASEIDRISPEEPISVRRLVVHGKHSQAILRVAEQEKVDLIVMGTAHKKDDVNKSYTTKEVLKKSKVPVLVVPINQ